MLALLVTAFCLFDCPLTTVRCALSAVHCPLCTVGCALSAVHCPLCTVRCALSAVHCPLCTDRCALCTVRCALAAVHCAVRCALCSPLYTVHCERCTSSSHSSACHTCMQFGHLLYIKSTRAHACELIVSCLAADVTCYQHTIVRKPSSQDNTNDTGSAAQHWKDLPISSNLQCDYD